MKNGSRNGPRDGNEEGHLDMVSWGGEEPAQATSSCAQTEPLLEGFYDGALDSDQAHAVAQHVAGCAHCTARMRRLEKIDRLIQAAPAPLPGPELRQQVYARIEAAHGTLTWRWSTRWRMRWGGGAAGEVSGPVGLAARPPQVSAAGLATQVPPPRALPTSAGWFSGTAAVAVVVALVLVFLSVPRHPNPIAATRATALSSATATMPRDPTLPAFALPRFAEWRVAYLSTDNYMHVVALDGTNDITGPAMTITTSAATSPDGHWLAYIRGPKVAPVVIANLTADARASDATRLVAAIEAYGPLYWSQDGARLAVLTSGGIDFITVKDAQPTLITATSPLGQLRYSELLGWIDPWHVALLAPSGPPSSSVAAIAPPGASSTLNHAVRALSIPLSGPRSTSISRSLVSLDIRTGAFNTLLTTASGTVSLSPDGTEAFVQDAWCAAPCASGTISPLLIDTATGQIHERTSGVGGVDPKWQPGAAELAVTMERPFPPSVAVVDLRRDTMQTLVSAAYVVSWSRDGQTLLVGRTKPDATGLVALSPVRADGHQVTLTTSISIFLGFVRTA